MEFRVGLELEVVLYTLCIFYHAFMISGKKDFIFNARKRLEGRNWREDAFVFTCGNQYA